MTSVNMVISNKREMELTQSSQKKKLLKYLSITKLLRMISIPKMTMSRILKISKPISYGFYATMVLISSPTRE
jgi:hypothetical protein